MDETKSIWQKNVQELTVADQTKVTLAWTLIGFSPMIIMAGYMAGATLLENRQMKKAQKEKTEEK